jgi:hypothetical protein
MVFCRIFKPVETLDIYTSKALAGLPIRNYSLALTVHSGAEAAGLSSEVAGTTGRETVVM